MPVNERLSLLLLIPANILYTVAVWTHTWFELPGVWYGLWWAKFCDFLGDCHIIPAFFTDEPGELVDILLLNRHGLRQDNCRIIILHISTLKFKIMLLLLKWF